VAFEVMSMSFGGVVAHLLQPRKHGSGEAERTASSRY
jgi:hypothetical protein